MKDFIHVCFALHDEYGNYSKYLGIAIMSLFEHTHSQICVHILCDDTISDINKKRFINLANQYGQMIFFYQISINDLCSLKQRVASLSIGTLFRLKMVETLPHDLNRIIYLDDDLLVNMDIRELWNIDLSDYILAACRDLGVLCSTKLPYPCVAGWVSRGKYFNAGVMVINLKKLRLRKRFSEECINFIKDNPKCFFVDQDVFNVFFKGQVYYLPKNYNLLSLTIRKEIDSEIYGICHFAGDYVNSEQPCWIDRLFFDYWERSPWNVSSEIFDYFLVREQRHAKQIILWQKIASVFIKRHRPFVIWGASSIFQEKLRNVCSELISPDWYVDSNVNLQGDRINDKEVKTPEVLASYKDGTKPFVLVMSKKYYNEISLKLIEYGYKENDDYGDANLLLLRNQGGVFVEY